MDITAREVVLTIVLIVMGVGGLVLSLLILRAIWRFISAPAVARAVGSAVTKVEDAYKEGRGR